MVWKDPNFIAEAKKRHLEPEPVASREFEELFKRLESTPPQILRRVAEILK
jgi:hypothetical protein